MPEEPRTELISVPCTARELNVIRLAATVSGQTPEEFALSASLWCAEAVSRGARFDPRAEV